MTINQLRSLYDKLNIANTRLTAVEFRRAIRKDVKASNPRSLPELNLIQTDNLRKSMLERYQKNGIKFGNTIYNDLKKQTTNTKKFNPFFSEEWAKFIREVYERDLANKIVSVKATIAKEIKRIVDNSIAEGEAVPDITAKIDEVVNSNQFYMWQAERVARTEVGSAMNQANDVAIDALDIELIKQWSAKLDGRERESHRRANGEVREKNEPFSTGYLRPHDPNAPASENVNCRCVLMYQPKKN